MKDYNFFENYEKRRSISISGGAPVIIGLIVVVLAAAASVGLLVYNHSLNQELWTLNSGIAQLKDSQTYAEAERLKESIDAMEQYDKSAEQALDRLESASVLGTEFMSRLAAAIPANSSILYIAADSSLARADFSIPDMSEGAELILSLKESGLFSYVHAGNTFLEQDGLRYIMSVQCELSGDLKAGEVQ